MVELHNDIVTCVNNVLCHSSQEPTRALEHAKSMGTRQFKATEAGPDRAFMRPTQAWQERLEGESGIVLFTVEYYT